MGCQRILFRQPASTSLTSAYLTGLDGHTYYFRVRARDNAGNQEAYVAGDGDTHTTIEVSNCHALTLSYTGSGSNPTASPPNSDDCPIGEYAAGEMIILTPHPATGYHLGFWTGTDNSASNSLTMPPNDHTVSAHYAHTGPISVAILDRASTSGISYWFGGNSNSWNNYRTILEDDPENRFAVTIITDLSSSTLGDFDRLLLPDNAVPDVYLTDVSNWFSSPDRLIVAADSAISYAAYSGFMWPDSAGSNGFGIYWDYGSTSNDQEVLFEDKITTGHAIGSLLPSRSSDAQMFVSQLPADAVAPTAKQTDHDKAYTAYRHVPGKGTIMVLGPFGVPGVGLETLIRNAVEGPEPNNAPHIPSNPTPADGAVDQAVSTLLTWTGGDPDPGDTVTYNVYLEANNPIPTTIVCENVATTACDPGEFVEETTYYWYVVATDNHGGEATGPVWNFTTASASACVLTWQAGINVTDNGGIADNLVIGQGPNATDGLDPHCGEAMLPPLPPPGSFDARLVLPGGTQESLSDFRPDSLTEVDWQMRFQPGGGGYPFTFTWNPADLPEGSVRLKDIFGGVFINVDMKTESSYVLSNTGITQLKIEYRLDVCLDVDLVAGWNMVSVPVQAVDMQLTTLFPDVSPPAYYYTNTYQPVQASDLLETGRGYWMYFENAQSYQLCGEAVVPSDIAVNAGWNMIGAFDYQAEVSGISSTPAGILNPPVYAYDNGYGQVDMLNPGEGYWAYVTEAGTLHVASSSSGSGTLSSAPLSSVGQPQDFRLPITVSAGLNNTVVRIGVSPEGGAGYDAGLDLLAPPLPPPGAFDARLIGDGDDFLMDVRSADEEEHIFIVRYRTDSDGTPIVLNWHGQALSELGTFEIMDLFGGDLLRLDMASRDELVIEPESVLSQGMLIRFVPKSPGHTLFLPHLMR